MPKSLPLPEIVDKIQNAEKRYYVALQKYATAATHPEDKQTLNYRMQALCEAFAELQSAHGLLPISCEPPAK